MKKIIPFLLFGLFACASNEKEITVVYKTPKHSEHKVNTFSKTVPLNFWNGKWTGTKDAGSSGDCALVFSEELTARITNGRVYIKQYNYNDNWAGYYPPTLNLKGSINEKSDFIIDKGGQYLGYPYFYTGFFNEKKQRLEGLWTHDECEGKWRLIKR